MAKLINSSFFVFKSSILRNYRVKYYDYIVNWYSGIACDWCSSLDIAYILALPMYMFLLKGIVSLRRIAELMSLQELVSNEDISSRASIGIRDWLDTQI